EPADHCTGRARGSVTFTGGRSMRRPVVAALAALATLLTTASACQPEDPEPTGAEPTAEPTGSTGPTETEEPTTPEPLDPTTVDLGNRVWAYEDAWTAPFEVPLEDGVAEGEWDLAGEGPMVYDEAERVVVDMDGDDDLDVVAPLTYQERSEERRVGHDARGG